MYLNSNFSDTWKVSNWVSILLLLLLLILFLWHLQVQHVSLRYRMCFVILSAVCYKVDTDNFLGFHRLYYCKCSCVYIISRGLLSCVFLAFLGLRRDFVSGLSYRPLFQCFPGWTCIQMCVLTVHKKNKNQNVLMCSDVMLLSVTLDAAYRTLWLMKGIGWRRQVIRMHGCVCHFQINVDHDVNKWHFAWYVLKTKPDSCILPRPRQPVSELSAAAGDVFLKKKKKGFKGIASSNLNILPKFILEEAAAVYFFISLIGFGCNYLLKEIQFSSSILGVVPLVIFMDFT